MKLVNVPRLVHASLYEETRDVIREKYKKTRGVRAVLDWGTVPYPGISDLDFYIIVDPGTHVSFPHFDTYTEDQRYAMNHRHHVISSKVFPFINHYDPWFVRMDALYDPDNTFTFEKKEFPFSSYKALSLNFIYQKITYGCLPFVADTYAYQKFNVRQFFEEFKQFKYFLREFKKFEVSYGEEDPALELYEKASDNWKELMKDTDRLMDLHKHFEGSIAWTYSALARAARENAEFVSPPSSCAPRTRGEKRLLKRYPQSLIVDAKDWVFVYQKGCLKPRIEHEFFRFPIPLYSAIGRHFFILPFELACFPAQHLFLKGILSEHYQRYAFTDLSEVPLWQDEELKKLYSLFNQNIAETAFVENAKYQEIHYRLNLQRSISASPLKRLRLAIGRMLSIVALALTRSSFGVIFRRSKRKAFYLYEQTTTNKAEAEVHAHGSR